MPANAIANFKRVQGTIAQAWSQGNIVATKSQTGLLVKQAVINGHTVRVFGRVRLDGSGVVEIANAFVMRK